MNCEEARENLSLYVAGDIERHGAREQIARHLEGCDPCRALAEEWEASRRLLQLQQPPEFDAAFFDSVRRGVMRQISEPRPSLLARLLGQPFGPRTLTYAAVFSLLVCAAVLSSHFLRRAHTPPAEMVKKEKNGGPGKVETNVNQSPGPREQETRTANVNKVNVVSPSPRPKPSPRRGVRRESAPERKFVSPSPGPDEEQAANAPRSPRDGSPEVGPQVAGSPNHVETAAADREMLRIELQTADPNVRIIWLSPRTTGSASSDKPNR